MKGFLSWKFYRAAFTVFKNGLNHKNVTLFSSNNLAKTALKCFLQISQRYGIQYIQYTVNCTQK